MILYLRFYQNLRYLCQCNYNIIWDGDFDMNLLSGNSTFFLINKLLCDYKLEVKKSVVSSNVNISNFTYKHDTQQMQSYIDYFIISKGLIDGVHDFDIIDCGSNLSDHNPIVLKVSFSGLKFKSRLCLGKNVQLSMSLSTKF